MEEAIYRVMVNRPLGLCRAEVRRLVNYQFSDDKIKKALSQMVKDQQGENHGRYYRAGRHNLAYIIHQGLQVRWNWDRDVGFGFSRNDRTSFNVRQKIVEKRDDILSDLISRTLDIYLKPMEYEKVLPIDMDQRFFMHKAMWSHSSGWRR